ncbi:MAG: hypothetical protein B7Z66_15370 [Chromatiales bacterium 21-64-14]|nr:MAG: hypothetical protein B7Z66_15370 [Chromatiales bacterium 21-64-14]
MRRSDDTPIDWRESCVTPPQAVDLVIGGLAAGEIGLFLNFAAYGRSWLALSIAAAVAGGLPVAAGPTHAAIPAPKQIGSVLLASAYETPQRVHRSIFLFAHWLRQQYASAKLPAPAGWDPRNLASHLRVVALRVPQPLIVPGPKHDEWVMGPGETWLRRAADGARLTLLDPIWHDFDEHDPVAMAALVNVLHHVADKTGTAFLLTHQAVSPLPRGLALLAERSSWVFSLHPMTPKTAEHFAIQEPERRRWLHLSENKGLLSTHPDRWLYLDAKGALGYANPAAANSKPVAGQLPSPPNS